MTNLSELIERVEAAKGPDRELDLLIMRWVENIGGRAATPALALAAASLRAIQSRKDG